MTTTVAPGVDNVRHTSAHVLRSTPHAIRTVLTSLQHCAHVRYRLVQIVTAPIPQFGAGFVLSRAYRAAGFRGIERAAFISGRIAMRGTGDISRNLRVESGVHISTDVTLNLDGPITLQSGCTLSPFVKIYTASHQHGPISQRCRPDVHVRGVVVEEGCWLGLGALVTPGVVIGRGSVVAAGAVVTKSVPPNSFVSGNPAVVTRTLSEGDDWFRFGPAPGGDHP